MDTHLASPQNIIRASYGELTPKQRQLAQLVLNNPYTIAFESANELASQLKVSPATVVRFSQSLGYSGYPEFQGAVRAHLPTSLTAAERGARDLAEEESVPARVLARVFNAERISIQRVEEEIDPEHTSAAAQIIADARSVLVLGPGVCGGVATYFAHSLQIMGIDATLITAGGIPLAVELIKLDEQGVLVTFAVWLSLLHPELAVGLCDHCCAARISVLRPCPSGSTLGLRADGLTDDEIPIFDTGFRISELQAAGLFHFEVRLPKNFTYQKLKYLSVL